MSTLMGLETLKVVQITTKVLTRSATVTFATTRNFYEQFLLCTTISLINSAFSGLFLVEMEKIIFISLVLPYMVSPRSDPTAKIRPSQRAGRGMINCGLSMSALLDGKNQSLFVRPGR